jgi:hypothetical protein
MPKYLRILKRASGLGMEKYTGKFGVKYNIYISSKLLYFATSSLKAKVESWMNVVYLQLK